MAPLMADIYMNYVLESKIIERTDKYFNVIFAGHISDTQTFGKFQLKFFGRYVDDNIAAFETREEAHNFLSYLNSLHPSIRFTMEDEVDGT